MNSFFDNDSGAALKVFVGLALFVVALFYSINILCITNNNYWSNYNANYLLKNNKEWFEQNKTCINAGGIPVMFNGYNTVQASCVWSKIAAQPEAK